VHIRFCISNYVNNKNIDNRKIHLVFCLSTAEVDAVRQIAVSSYVKSDVTFFLSFGGIVITSRHYSINRTVSGKDEDRSRAASPLWPFDDFPLSERGSGNPVSSKHRIYSCR